MSDVQEISPISLGEAGRALGVPVTTLRSWGDRYGIGPSHRTPGGHRRFTERDLARLRLMKALVDQGTPASYAARAALVSAPDLPAAALGDPARSSEPVPPDLRPEVYVPVVLDAVRRLDTDETRRLYRRALSSVGVVTAWTEILVPTLRAIGQEWADGVLGIECEHMASQVLGAELRLLTRRTRDGRTRCSVMVAAEDDHGLPLLALEAGLADQQVTVHSLGSRLPPPVLARSIDSIGPDGVFLWSSLRTTRTRIDQLREAHPGVRFVLGGPGWQRPDPLVADDLGTAISRLVNGDGLAS